MREQREIVERHVPTSALEPTPKALAATPLPDYGMYHAAEEEEAHLRDYFRAVRKHLWLIFGICMLTAMIATLYMARKPDVYEAQARVQVDLENTGSAL